MFSSQQIMCCLLSVLISVLPLVLFSQENAKVESGFLTEENEPEKTEKKKIENLDSDKSEKKTIVIKSSSDKTSEEEQLAGEETAEPEQDQILREDLVHQFNEIIKKVQENYPVLAETLSDKKKKKILKAVVNTLDRGMEYVSAEELNDRKIEVKSEIDPFPAVMIASNRILYIRLDTFSDNIVKQLKEDCDRNFKLARKPLGIIIDIRSTQCFDYKCAIQALGIFASEKKIKKFNLYSNYKQTFKCPVILLTGEKTAGASEVFAKLLIDMKRSISLGEKTAGIPFRKQKFILSNGDFLLIPQIPDMLADMIPESVKPSIFFKPYPQLPYEKISGISGAEKNDKCIQRAVELIICLNALGE